MRILEINNKSIWQKFFDENGSPSFLQSWEWGELQKKLGYEIIRMGIYNNDSLKAIAQIVKIKSKRGNFLFIPHGPIIKVKSPACRQARQKSKVKTCLKYLQNYLTNTVKKENYSFIRIAPILEDTEQSQKIFQELGFRKSPIYMHAERVWVLDLNKPEEQLLIAMRKTTRYLIKKANHDGVVIEKRTDSKAVGDFYKIYVETAKRENFIPFSKKYIKEEFETFNKTGNALFLFGRISETGVDPFHLCSALVIFTKSTAFYHQGASIHTKIPVTYALQWEAIKEAKKRGCQFYNFWGVFQEGRTPKSWTGLTLFKQGFGGNQIDYLPTQDFIISPKYYLTFVYEKILKWRRGF